MKKQFKTIECPDVVSFESAVEELINAGWKLVNANSLTIPEPGIINVFYYGFLIKES